VQEAALRVHTTDEDAVGKCWLLRLRAVQGDCHGTDSSDKLDWLEGVTVESLVMQQWQPDSTGSGRVLAPTLAYLQLTRDFHHEAYHKRWGFVSAF
jgi:hypothetical protein